MWSSALRECMLVIAAAAAGIAVVTAWPHDRSSRCSQPSPASVEMLFAPCLVVAQTTSPAYKDLEHARIREDAGEALGMGAVPQDLHDLGCAISARNLHDAQPVAMRIESQGLGINGDHVARLVTGRQIAAMKADSHERDKPDAARQGFRVPLLALLIAHCPP